MVVAQVVAHWTTDVEVLTSIPVGSWAFFTSLSYLNQWCVLNQVHRGGGTLLIFELSMKKMEGLALQLEAKQA